MRSARAEVVAIGLDMSLLESGLIAIPSDWGGDWSRCATLHFSSDPEVAGFNSAPLDRIQRIDRIAKATLRFVLNHAHLGVKIRLAMENYAYSRFNAATLGEVGGALKLELYRAGYQVQPVVMQSARKHAVGTVSRGTGMKPKDYVRSRLTAAGMPPGWSMDVGDAFVTANYVLADYPGASLIVPPPEPTAAPGKKRDRKNRPATSRKASTKRVT